MTLAFFDLDKTLITVNSASLWVRLQWREGKLTAREMLKLTFGLLRYHLGMANLEDDLRLAIMRLKGESNEQIQLLVETFYREQLQHRYRPGALKTLDEHRQNGDRIALLTSSPHLLARLVAKDLSVSDCLCTELEVDDKGHYTGQIVGPLCFGAGKVEMAQNHARMLGISLSACTFYTDSVTDLPMLRSVGTPVVVNPDPRLRRAARIQKWQIVDWGVPYVAERARQTTR